tara:strand:+ start:270 stop:458 length:189 start_codon:yes stop_codon:yes gene_type:complete
MAEQEHKWKEAELRRDDIKKLLENTKKLAEMYTDVLKIKREGWERVLAGKANRAKKEQEKNG